MSESVVIVGAKRTPVGAFQGQFAGMTAPQLASVAIKAAVEQAGVKGEDIDEALMGCCLMAGLRQAPARQAVLGAGLPKSVPCVTLTKMCSSAQKTVMIAHDELLAGSINIAVAGGMESMTNAPHVLTTARSGYRLGNGVLHDHMFLDGLEDAYEQGKLMGAFAELCVDKYSFSREEMDAFAIESVTRAQKGGHLGSLQCRDRAGHRHLAQGRRSDRPRRDADEVRRVEDHQAEAGIQEGWRGDTRQLVVDFRRRSGLCPDARIRRQERRHHAAGADRRPCDLCPRPGLVYHRARSLPSRSC
jgi:acetyl-CoA C-acetyltransferase